MYICVYIYIYIYIYIYSIIYIYSNSNSELRSSQYTSSEERLAERLRNCKKSVGHTNKRELRGSRRKAPDGMVTKAYSDWRPSASSCRTCACLAIGDSALCDSAKRAPERCPQLYNYTYIYIYITVYSI